MYLDRVRTVQPRQSLQTPHLGAPTPSPYNFWVADMILKLFLKAKVAAAS